MIRLTAFALSVSISCLAAATDGKTIIKVKKTGGQSAPNRVMKRVGTDDKYDYYEVSYSELKIIEAARRAFTEAKKLPPPPESLQRKMQDQVGSEENGNR